MVNIANSFTPQAETLALYPFLGVANPDLSDPVVQAALGTFIDNVYANLFNRAPDAGGKSYWLGQIETHQVTLAEAILAIANGATGSDAILLQNKITVALDFTTRTTAAGQGLGTPDQALLDAAHNVLTGVDGTALGDASVTTAEAATTAFINSGAGLPGTTLSFTTGVDNLVGTGGSDNFTGTITGTATQTFNPGDTANGGSGGVDRVSVVDSLPSGANELAGVNFVHIGEFLDQNVSGGLNLFDFSAAQGVHDAIAFNTLAGGADAFLNLATGAKVFATGAGTGGGTAVDYNMKTGTDAVSLGVRSGVNGVFFGNIGPGTATSATIQSLSGPANGKVSSPDFFQLTSGGGAATITSLAVQADANLVAGLFAGDFKATGAALTVSGAASAVNLNGGAPGVWKSIDASGLTIGGLTVNGDAALVSFKGGGGNDFLTAGAAPTAATSIDGGTGTNVLASDLITLGNGAVFKNWQTLDVTAQGGVTLDTAVLTNDTVSGVQFTGGSGAQTILNLTPAITVTQTGSGIFDTGLTITHSSASGDATALVLNNTSAAATASTLGFFAATGDVTDTISSSALFATSVNVIGQMAMTDNHLTTVTATGAAHLFLGAPTGAANTGDGVVTDTGLAAATGVVASSLTMIDASATTGGLNIFAGATNGPGGGAYVNGVVQAGGDTITYNGLAIKGGSGLDIIENDATGGSVTDGNHAADVMFLGGSGMTGTAGTGAGDTIVVGASLLGTPEAAGAALGGTVTFGAGATGVLSLAVGTELGATALLTTNLGQNAFNSANVTGAVGGETIAFSSNAHTGALVNETAVAAGQASLAAAINAVTVALGSSNIGFFTLGADEYIVATSAAAQGATPDDQVVHLVGVNTLTHGVATGGVVTLA